MYTYISIPQKSANGAKVGDKAFVKIIRWSGMEHKPLGEVVRVLGKAGEHEAEMQGIILERGFESEFPPEVEAEALRIKNAGVSPEEISKRRDMRDITTFTIDPEDAKDFDDALSFQKLPNGNFEIGVHIADVSHYVQPKTPLDNEALERATSVYLVDRTIPMLPEVLSNDLCSLNPNEDKLTMSAVFEMDMEGRVLKDWFGRTIINSDKRFSYEEAQGVLDAGKGLYYDELNTLNQIAKKLTKGRIKEGAIMMETDEVKFKLDEHGKPISVFIKQRGDTNKLIEEFMLLANKHVAKYGSKGKDGLDRVFLYRIHGEPDQEKIRALKDYLKLLGYDLPEKNGKVNPKEFNRLFAELEGQNEQSTIQSVVVRSMQKAIYSVKNIGHYGLAFDFYTHFTSPIRRYPDIIAHRLLEEYLSGKKFGKERNLGFEQMAEHCSMREVEAAEAERASVKYKQIEYMSERIGEEFDGVITGFADWGMYVAEKTTRSEGAIRLRDVAHDVFIYDEKKMVLVGQKSGRIMRIGDELRISVKAVDVEKQLIDYHLVDGIPIVAAVASVNK
jgi:ribonuclease R